MSILFSFPYKFYCLFPCQMFDVKAQQSDATLSLVDFML